MISSQSYDLKGILTYYNAIALGVLWLLMNYAWGVLRYHSINRSKTAGVLPPRYPSIIPYLGTTVQLLYDTRGAISRSTYYNGRAALTRLAILPGVDVYFFQDPKIVWQAWRDSSALLDFRPLATRVLRYGCGMPKNAAALYLADDSGSHAKPLPGSSVPEDMRIHRMIHVSDREALTGRGLSPTFQKYAATLITKMDEKVLEDWIEIPDFWGFVQETVGATLIEAIFGPSLLSTAPEFITNLFKFDDFAPMLIRGIPNTKARRARDIVLSQFKHWARFAKGRFSETDISPDDDRDSFWGSAWTRYRHSHFTRFFNEDAMASNDLAVSWGAVANTVPCTMMAALHVIQDKALLKRVRQELDDSFIGKQISDIDTKSLSRCHLLNPIYAETLRLYITVFVPIIPLHGQLSVGRWRVPKGSLGAVNAAISHMDENIWNTESGRHPVQSFWAERFLVYPTDPSSGPVKPEHRADRGEKLRKGSKDGAYFSTEGLDGSWIPYGGGHSMCPGRFLAKGVITFTCALLAMQYDIELLVNSVPLKSGRFGMGVEHPMHAIPFRIRKRGRC